MIESRKTSKIIIIGSSTGGPIILEKIFTDLPYLPVVIIIVQHIRKAFVIDLQGHIQSGTKMDVIVPSDNEKVKAGCVYITPADYHLVLRRNEIITLNQSAKVNFVRPSIDVTMQSVIPDQRHVFAGIILTGMGNDGTEGVKYLKSIGGTVIAQDPTTAPIGSMPLNSINTGIIDAIYTPAEINRYIVRFAEKRRFD